jgi:hypothetical protein
MRAVLVASALLVAGLTVPALGATAVDSTGTTYSTDRVVVPITFPVLGATSYSDNFLACRSGCARKHMGQDLMGPKMSPLVAACSGTVVTLKRETRVGDGNYVGIACEYGAAKGWTAMYLHVNNDSPGTDNGRGTGTWDFPTGIAQGARVLEGQLVGWRGDSGNAESTGPHLHFELRKGTGWSGVVYNAYPSLRAARHIARPTQSGPHPDGSLLRVSNGSMYVIKGGKRWGVSTTTRTANRLPYASAIPVSWLEMAMYPAGGRLPLRSGALVRDPAGQVWRVSGSTRFATVALPGQQVFPVGNDDLSGLETVALPDSVLVPGLLVKGPGLLAQVGDDGALHKVSSYVLKAMGLTAADAVELPLDLPLPRVGSDAAFPEGSFVSAYGVGVGIVSDGRLRRLRDEREVAAYGYGGRPRLAVPPALVSGLQQDELTTTTSGYGGYQHG